MGSTIKKSPFLFYLYAFATVIVALYHVNRYFFTPIGESATRHLVFVGVCTICVFGLLKRPGWFLYFFGALTLQQIYSHGSSLLHQWNDLHSVNYMDLGAVVMTPVIFVSLIRNRYAAS